MSFRAIDILSFVQLGRPRMKGIRSGLGILLISSTAGWPQFYQSAAHPQTATSISLGEAAGLAADPATGNVFISSSSLNSVFLLTPSGTLARVAGDDHQ